MKGSSSLFLLLLLTLLLAVSGGAWAPASAHAIFKRNNINETTIATLTATTTTTTTTTTLKPRDSKQSKNQSRANTSRSKLISPSSKKSSNDTTTTTTTTTESPLLRLLGQVASRMLTKQTVPSSRRDNRRAPESSQLSSGPSKSSNELPRAQSRQHKAMFRNYHPPASSIFTGLEQLLELDNFSKASNEKKKPKKQQKDKQKQRPYKTNLPDSKIYYIKQKPNQAKPATPRPDSPVHYIKLPPEPYVYDQTYGGYISRPPAFFSYHEPEQNSALLRVPVKFLSNGKPNGVYTLPQKRPSIHTSSDSPIIRLNGSYKFNGKPSRVYLATSEDDQRDSPVYQLNNGSAYAFNGKPHSHVYRLQQDAKSKAARQKTKAMSTTRR